MAQVVTKTTYVALSKKLEGQIATAVVGATLLFGCEVRGFSSKEERENETLWSRVVFGITRQKRGEVEQDKKTLADQRIACKMKPILDLIRIRQLNFLASLARLPDDRLENCSPRSPDSRTCSWSKQSGTQKHSPQSEKKTALVRLTSGTWLKDWEKLRSMLWVGRSS